LRIRLAPGVRLEGLGDGWYAFSAVSGETHQINPEAAAMLEWLAAGPMTESALCEALASDTSVDAATIHATLGDVWPALEAAGLIRTEPAAPSE
jgi:PqqD family protein of HPr-rel-A system